MDTTKTTRRPARPAARRTLHNPRATASAPCICPACCAHATAEGKRRADEWNDYARSKTRFFSIILTGDKLAPRFLPGDCLAIDSDRQPQPGDAVLVTIEKYGRRVMVLNGDFDALDLRGGYAPRGAFTVAGVVVDSSPARRCSREDLH